MVVTERNIFFALLLKLTLVCLPRIAVIAANDKCFATNATTMTEQQLADIFFKPYGDWQRPRKNGSQPVVVSIQFALQAINNIVERDGIMHLTGFLRLGWMDQFRAWNYSFPYNCIDYLTIPATKIWLPDVAQVNSEQRYLLLRRKGELVRIYKNGTTSYSPGGTFNIFCHFDLTLFPFDVQTCHIKLESWKVTTAHLLFKLGGIYTIDFEESEQWRLIKMTGHTKNLEYPGSSSFAHVTFSIVIERKAAYYVMDVILPSLFLGIAFLATFLLPHGNPEKLNISFTCLLAYSVFQSMVYSDMPRSSDKIPLLVIYISLQMAFIAFSMLGQGLSLTALEESRRDPSHRRKLPKCLLVVIKRLRPGFQSRSSGEMKTEHFSNHIGGESTDAVVTPEFPSEEASQVDPTEDERNHNEWIVLGEFIERAVAVLYVVSISVTTLVIFVVIPAIADGEIEKIKKPVVMFSTTNLDFK